MLSLKLPSVLTTANPIVNAEFHHQRFVIQRGRVGGIWILLAGLMVLPALLISLGFTIAGLLSPIVPQAQQVIQLSAGSMPAWLWLGIMNVAMYPVVTLITFGLSANSIRREKTGNTWDNLRLTGLDARHIVMGKWWASLRALNGDHGMIVVLRFGVAAAFIMFFDAMSMTAFRLPAAWTLLPALLVITVIYGLLDAGLTAALGITGATVDRGGPVVPFILFSVRVVTAFLACVLWFVTLFTVPAGWVVMLLLSLIGFIGYGLVIWLVLKIAQTLVE